mgnify:FL=1
MIRDERDKFGISGLALCGVYRVGEYPGEYVDIAAVPCYLYGVADSSLHTGACGLVTLCNSWVEQLRDAVYHLVVVD